MVVIDNEVYMVVKEDIFVYKLGELYVFSDVPIVGTIYRENVNSIGNIKVARPVSDELESVEIDMIPSSELAKCFTYNVKMRTLVTRKIDRLRSWHEVARKYFIVTSALANNQFRDLIHRQSQGSGSKSLIGMFYDGAHHEKLVLNNTVYYDVITIKHMNNELLVYRKGNSVVVNGDNLLERFKELYTEEHNETILDTYII